MFLKFPEDNTGAHFSHTRDNDSDEEQEEEEDLSTSGIYFDLPASLEELQKELLGD
jgi:hypothetical protein